MSARISRWATPAIALLAIASSAIGIVNEFTYDDKYIIEKNPVMRDLLHWWRAFASSYWPRGLGGDGYRPLTILSFKIEYAIGGGRPMVFHAVNILLYAAAAVLVFWLARRVLPTWAAWLAAAFFAVHPVHVEAVANVVGQSELIVAVVVLSATSLYLRDRMNGNLRPATGVAITGLYAIACLAKEHAIVLPALLVVAELTVIGDATPWRERIRRERLFYLVLALVAVGMVGVRSYVLADHSLGGFQPFTPFNTLHISSRDRTLTALGVVPEWIRLLFWPARLSSEYGPPEIEIAQGFSVSLLPGLMLLLAILGLGVALRRRQPVISFGIAFTCLVLLPSSNFLLPAGIVLAERTLFLPSVGAMLIVGDVALFLAEHLRDGWAARVKAPIVAGVVCGALMAAAMARSIQRTTVWRDNDRLFRQAVLDSPLDYRAHFMLGAWAFQQDRKREGEAEYRRALALFPYDPFLAYDMAEQYRAVGMCKPAVPLYRWSQGLDPAFPLGRGALAWCLLTLGEYKDAKEVALESLRRGGDAKAMRRLIAVADSIPRAQSADTGKGAVVMAGSRGKLPVSVQKAGGQKGDPPGS